jgi:hypothetical protein
VPTLYVITPDWKIALVHLDVLNEEAIQKIRSILGITQ